MYLIEKIILNIFISFLGLLFFSSYARASAHDFNVKNNTQSFLYVNGTSGSVGLGTTIAGTGVGLTVMNGNVGIGTYNPVGPLQIKAATDEDGFFQTNQNLSDGVAFSSINDANTANKGLELRGSIIQLSTIGANPIYFLTNDSFNGEGTIRETIDKNGNVGIGTYGSGGVLNQRLTVVGNIGVGVSGPPADLFTNNAPPNGGMIIESNVGIGTWAPVGLLDVDHNLNVFSNGNVGIGSLAPGADLDVQGTIRASGGYVGTVNDPSDNAVVTVSSTSVTVSLQ